MPVDVLLHRLIGLSDQLVPVADACLVRQLDLCVPLRFGGVLVKLTVDVVYNHLMPVVEHRAGEHGRILAGLTTNVKTANLENGLLFIIPKHAI